MTYVTLNNEGHWSIKINKLLLSLIWIGLGAILILIMPKLTAMISLFRLFGLVSCWEKEFLGVGGI